jgi:phosphatidylglycerophosphate synthase
LLIVLRFAHVVFGSLWVGMLVFTTFFVAPAAVEVGPEGGKLMAALARRKVMVIMPLLALITLVSGFWLFQIMSGGQHGAFMATPMGMAFGLGGIASLIGFLLGITVMRPAMMRVQQLSASPVENAAEIRRLRARGSTMGTIVAVLLLFALSAMAVARYL